MPNSAVNGHSETIANGHSTNRFMGYEMCDGNFLFTSESVGEGHPGKEEFLFLGRHFYHFLTLYIAAFCTYIYYVVSVYLPPSFQYLSH